MADSDRRELLLGCGAKRDKQLYTNNQSQWHNLTTLDINSCHKPDLVHDLTQLPYPFAENSFDEIHAYEVLEHTGAQGDYRFFFAQMSEFWRILRPLGILVFTCPAPGSPWAWGDPSHTRVLQKEQMVFLDQDEYSRQIGKTAMTDFRYLYQADLRLLHYDCVDETQRFILQAVKPSRISG